MQVSYIEPLVRTEHCVSRALISSSPLTCRGPSFEGSKKVDYLRFAKAAACVSFADGVSDKAAGWALRMAGLSYNQNKYRFYRFGFPWFARRVRHFAIWGYIVQEDAVRTPSGSGLAVRESMTFY